MTLSHELFEESRQLFLLMNYLHNNLALQLYNKMLRISLNKNQLNKSHYISFGFLLKVATPQADDIAVSEVALSEPSSQFLKGLLVPLQSYFSAAEAKVRFLLALNRLVSD